MTDRQTNGHDLHIYSTSRRIKSKRGETEEKKRRKRMLGKRLDSAKAIKYDILTKMILYQMSYTGYTIPTNSSK